MAPSAFVLTSAGATIERSRSGSATSKSLSAGDERLRRSVIFACGMEAALVIFLAVFLLQHADPRGDGMEMVGVGFAFMIFFYRLPCLRSFLHGMDVGSCSRPDWRLSRQSRISLFGSKSSASWGFLNHKSRTVRAD